MGASRRDGSVLGGEFEGDFYYGRDMRCEGEFTVNLSYYDSKNGQPVEATVSVIKVNPRAEVVFYGTLTLARKGDEATACRFTVLPDGGVTSINTLAKPLVQRS